MDSLDIAIVGAGPTGLATAIEAQRRGLTYAVFDKGCITNSILGFPSHMVSSRHRSFSRSAECR